MASGKSKTSFCIDSLLAQDKTSVKNSPSSPLPLTTSSSLLSSGHEHFLLSSYGDSIRFRSNLFGGLQHHHHHFQMFDPPHLIPAGSSGSKQPHSDQKQQTGANEAHMAEDRPQSNSSSDKEENGVSSPSTVVAAGDGQQKSDNSSVTCWQQPHSVSRMAYGPVSTTSTPIATTSSTMTSSATSPTSVNYPGQLFGSQAAALHAAAAAAAAVAASSPSAHQFHSAHLEWLARAGVLYHRFGGDLAGQFYPVIIRNEWQF